MNKIDYIFPWVNPKDLIWQQDFLKYSNLKITEINERFNRPNTLKYLLRGIDKYMPWINNVYIIVSNKSQLPEWINTNTLKPIYHQDFIPKEFLPTFNSNTIEMFLSNINYLENNIIYGNDDIITIKETKPTDFFSENNTPKIFYKEQLPPKKPFFKMAKRCWDLVSEIKSDTYTKQEHINVSWNKETLKSVYNKYEDSLIQSISNFRNFDKNYNQYIYADFQISNENVIQLNKSSKIGSYIKTSNLGPMEIVYTLDGICEKTICINDIASAKNYTVHELDFWLKSKFPDKSKFEL